MDLSNVFFNVPLGHLVIVKGFLKGADVSDLAVCKRILILADRRGLFYRILVYLNFFEKHSIIIGLQQQLWRHSSATAFN